ncbi:MAG: tetratricopeptide repeat protein [Acidobacteriota bacterium]
MDDGVAAFDARQFADARARLEPCAGTDARAALYSGRAFLAEGDLDRAVSALEKAAALDPRSAQAQVWLGRAWGQKAMRANVFSQASMAGKVRRAFERAVELDSDNLDARIALVEYYSRAPGIMGGSTAKARAQAADIRRRDPLRGHQAWGRIAELEKRWDDAAAEYQQAATEFPSRREPFVWRANLAAHRKDYARAFEVLESRLRAQPDDATIEFSIGRLGAQSGERLGRAEECLKRYLQHTPAGDEPSLAAAHFQLGAIYDRRDDRDLARAEYRQALALEPSMPAAKEALANRRLR